MAKEFVLTTRLRLLGPETSQIDAVLNTITDRIRAKTVSLGVVVDPNSIAMVSQLKSQLKDTVGVMNQLKSTGSTVTSSFNNISNAVNQTTIANKKVTASQNEFNSSMEQFGHLSALAIRRNLAFTITAFAVYGVGRALHSAVSEAIIFDREMVKLRQLSSDSDVVLKGIETTISQLSISLGTSSNALIKTSNTLIQAGYSISDTKIMMEALAKTTLAPTFGSIANTTEGLIAILHQFNLKAYQSEQILGSINKVAADYAMESSDVIEAAKRSGSVFSSLGGNFNEFIGILTAVRQTTRLSAETIATGMNTIFARMQRPATIRMLEELGIKLQDVNAAGQKMFVGPMESIRRISDGLKNIDPRTSLYSKVIDELGGVRQLKVVIPMIQQRILAEEAMQKSMDGTTSLSKDVVESQKAISIQFEMVKEKFLDMTRTFVEGGTFRSLATGAMTFARALIDVANALQTIAPLLAVLSGAVLFNSMTKFMGRSGFLSTFTGRKAATGGIIPGTGDTDTVPALLTPGEFVIRKSAVKAIGRGPLEQLNRYASGGIVTGGRHHYGISDISDSEFMAMVGKAKNNAELTKMIEDKLGIKAGGNLRNATKTRMGQLGVNIGTANLSSVSGIAKNVDSRGISKLAKTLRDSISPISNLAQQEISSRETSRVTVNNTPTLPNRPRIYTTPRASLLGSPEQVTIPRPRPGSLLPQTERWYKDYSALDRLQLESRNNSRVFDSINPFRRPEPTRDLGYDERVKTLNRTNRLQSTKRVFGFGGGTNNIGGGGAAPVTTGEGGVTPMSGGGFSGGRAMMIGLGMSMLASAGAANIDKTNPKSKAGMTGLSTGLATFGSIAMMSGGNPYAVAAAAVIGLGHAIYATVRSFKESNEELKKVRVEEKFKDLAKYIDEFSRTGKFGSGGSGAIAFNTAVEFGGKKSDEILSNTYNPYKTEERQQVKGVGDPNKGFVNNIGKFFNWINKMDSEIEAENRSANLSKKQQDLNLSYNEERDSFAKSGVSDMSMKLIRDNIISGKIKKFEDIDTLEENGVNVGKRAKRGFIASQVSPEKRAALMMGDAEKEVGKKEYDALVKSMNVQKEYSNTIIKSKEVIFTVITAINKLADSLAYVNDRAQVFDNQLATIADSMSTTAKTVKLNNYGSSALKYANIDPQAAMSVAGTLMKGNPKEDYVKQSIALESILPSIIEKVGIDKLGSIPESGKTIDNELNKQILTELQKTLGTGTNIDRDLVNKVTDQINNAISSREGKVSDLSINPKELARKGMEGQKEFIDGLIKLAAEIEKSQETFANLVVQGESLKNKGIEQKTKTADMAMSFKESNQKSLYDRGLATSQFVSPSERMKKFRDEQTRLGVSSSAMPIVNPVAALDQQINAAKAEDKRRRENETFATYSAPDEEKAKANIAALEKKKKDVMQNPSILPTLGGNEFNAGAIDKQIQALQKRNEAIQNKLNSQVDVVDPTTGKKSKSEFRYANMGKDAQADVAELQTNASKIANLNKAIDNLANSSDVLASIQNRLGELDKARSATFQSWMGTLGMSRGERRKAAKEDAVLDRVNKGNIDPTTLSIKEQQQYAKALGRKGEEIDATTGLTNNQRARNFFEKKTALSPEHAQRLAERNAVQAGMLGANGVRQSQLDREAKNYDTTLGNRQKTVAQQLAEQKQRIDQEQGILPNTGGFNPLAGGRDTSVISGFNPYAGARDTSVIGGAPQNNEGQIKAQTQMATFNLPEFNTSVTNISVAIGIFKSSVDIFGTQVDKFAANKDVTMNATHKVEVNVMGLGGIESAMEKIATEAVNKALGVGNKTLDQDKPTSMVF